MLKLSAIAVILGSAACAHPMVAMHTLETDKNHYVIISDGAADQYLDCYSQASGKWEPTCKEVRVMRYRDGSWDERTRERY